MSSITPARQPSMAALLREAEQYLDALTAPQKTLMNAAQEKVHNYAKFAGDSSVLPDLKANAPLAQDDENLALNLGVVTLKWLQEVHLDQIKVGDRTLQKTIFDLCRFCVSEVIAERDGTKNIPIRPARAVSVPVKPDLPMKESPPKPTVTAPDSPRKKLLRRGKQRADSAPEKPLRALPSVNKPTKAASSSSLGQLKFVMPKDTLNTNETFMVVEGAFVKLSAENRMKILEWLKKSEGEPIPTGAEVMQKIQIKSIADMCKNLSKTERAQLVKRLSSTPFSV